MPIGHRRIPVLPVRPRVHPVAVTIRRSYPVGRQSFSRVCQKEVLALTITTAVPLPESVQARLVTTMNSGGGDSTTEFPFVRAEEGTMTCRITPERPGRHSFRAEFSTDSGLSWQGDTVPDAWVLVDPPQVENLRLYTLIPTVSGTVADWKADLRRIQRMGFNAVHLLPVTAMDTSASPYAARDLFAIDPSYQTKGGSRQEGLSELEEFIEEAKALNIRLCFDLVLNHVGVLSDMARRAPDWIVPDENQEDGLKRARYWTDQGWLNWNDLVLINYEHPSYAIRSEIRAYMTDYALFWAKFANATGGFIRLDNLHSSDKDFIQSLTAALHSEHPGVAILAEYFTDDGTLLDTVPRWGLNLVLATPWNFKFVPQLRAYLKYLHCVSENVRYFMPITSHDSGSPAQEFGTSDSTIPRYVAAALLGMGATGIPQGVEWGEQERVDFIGKREQMPFSGVPRFAEFFGKINAILAAYPTFWRGGNCIFVDAEHPAVIAALRQEAGTSSAGFLVICNFDTHSQQRFAADLSHFLGTSGPLNCRDLLSGEEQTLPHPQIEVLLPPCSAQVFQFTERAVRPLDLSMGM